MAHKARHSLKNLYIDDMATGVLFGFFEQMMTICSHPRFCSNKVVIVTDSRTSFRKDSYDGYKSKRQQNRTEEDLKQIKIMHKQVKLLRKKILPAMGIRVYGQKGLEGDDIMAVMTRDLSSMKQDGVLVTSDGDLYQCITKRVSWYDPTRDLYYTPELFMKAKDVTPKQWGMVKAIGGCTSDSVPGLKGVSETGAIAWMTNKIPPHHKKYSTIKDALDDGSIEKWKELVILPHRKTKTVNLKVPKYKPEVFYEFCEKYEMYSFLSGNGKKQWDNFFKNKFKNKPRKRGLL